MSSHKKIYTDILETITLSMVQTKKILEQNPTIKKPINMTKVKKMTCSTIGISVSTYNKYLRELKNGTYVKVVR